MLKQFVAAAVIGAGVLASQASQAGVYSVSVNEGLTGGAGFQTLNTSPFNPAGGNVASATFTYTGALNFSDTLPQNSGPTGDLNSVFGFSTSNVSNYVGSGTVFQGPTQIADYRTLAGFLASSGSANSYQYGSYYAIDLGVLASGTILTVTHDDGISVYQGSTRLGTTNAGPTTQTTDIVAIGSTADTFLYYSRQNGTPSILTVAVPEPASLALFGAGLIGLTMVARRRRA